MAKTRDLVNGWAKMKLFISGVADQESAWHNITMSRSLSLLMIIYKWQKSTEWIHMSKTVWHHESQS